IWFSIVSISELIKGKNLIDNIVFYGPIFGGVIAQLGLMGVFSSRELSVDYRLSFEGIGVNSVSISIGYMLILGIAFLMAKDNAIIYKILILCCCIVMFYFIIRTGTRSGVYGVLIATGIAYLFSFKVSAVFVIRFLILSTFFVFTFHYILENYVGERLVERIFSVQGDDIASNSRNELWNVAFDYFSYNIFGTGAGNEPVAYLEYGLGPKEAHNVFVSGLLQLGFIGLFILVIAHVMIFFNLFQTKDSISRFTTLSLFF